MIKIYHLKESRSDRIVWLMEELGLPYELEVFQRTPDMMAPPEYRALHPMGTSPIVSDGDFKLIETGGIIEYILDRYGDGRLQPERGTRERGLYYQWMHFAEGGAAFSILSEALAPRPTPDRPKPSRNAALWRSRNDRMLAYLNGDLAERPYLCGDAFTAADIMMAYALQIFERFIDRPLADYPNLVTYSERVFSRPAYVKAMKLLYPEGRPAKMFGRA